MKDSIIVICLISILAITLINTYTIKKLHKEPPAEITQTEFLV